MPKGIGRPFNRPVRDSADNPNSEPYGDIAEYKNQQRATGERAKAANKRRRWGENRAKRLKKYASPDAKPSRANLDPRMPKRSAD